MAPRAKCKPGFWSPEADEVLRLGVCRHGGKKWKVIAGLIKHKTSMECCQRWRELQNTGTAVKRSWLPFEDERVMELVDRYGAQKWAVIASHIDGRTGKQCRERWHNQLNPAISKAPWTPQEDEVILRSQAQYGNRWAKITEKLPGRTDNSVKNHWYSSINSARKATPSHGASSAASDAATEQYPLWLESVLVEAWSAPDCCDELKIESDFAWDQTEEEQSCAVLGLDTDDLDLALSPMDSSQLSEFVDEIFESVCDS